jgi:hypothetical protein
MSSLIQDISKGEGAVSSTSAGGTITAGEVESTRRVNDDVIESSTAELEIDRLCKGDSKWRNLNPFSVLLLPPDCTTEDIKQRYRKLSTLIHPDKCSHPLTRDAFETVKNAFMILQDNTRRENAVNLMNGARKHILNERKKLITKGVEESTLPDLEETVRIETLKVFAQGKCPGSFFSLKLSSPHPLSISANQPCIVVS